MLVDLLKEREQRARALEEKLAHARTTRARPEVDVEHLENEARERLRDFFGLMQRHPTQARKVIEAMLRGPLRFVASETGQGRRYRIEGPIGMAEMAVCAGD